MRHPTSGVLAVLFCLVVSGAACSSSSTSGSSDAVFCDDKPGSGRTCTCYATSACGGAAGCSSVGNSVSCSVATLVDAVCYQRSENCYCQSFNCFGTSAITCTYLSPTSDTKAADVSSCVGAHHCMTASSSQCTCSATPCGGDMTEVKSCTDATARTAMHGYIEQKFSTVEDCRVSAASAGKGSGLEGTDAGSGNAKCSAAGPGTCGDMPSLNHCNCGAGCYRNAAAAGSGFSCHITCTTDDDCMGLYDHATTCQTFTADVTSPLKECR